MTGSAAGIGGAVHLDLDGSWESDVLGIPRFDLREWGPRLRYIARRKDVEAFWRAIGDRLPRYVIYGSGDFHHLAGVLIRRVSERPLHLISFDNHPDWDRRPPYWSCGGWAARTLRAGSAQQVSVWGCGNFELQAPARWFADRAALRAGTFEVHAWAERQPASVWRRFDCVTRENWRERFERFVAGLRGRNTYITVDMDCLRAEEAVTNWENGLFTAADVAWGIGALRRQTRVAGVDICGAHSAPSYARWWQRFAGGWDHPKQPIPDESRARQVNRTSLTTLWEAAVL